MFGKCTVSAAMAAILTITASAAEAAPRKKKQPPTINRPVPVPSGVNRSSPMSGAEWFQDKGVSEELKGVPYQPRR
jgi:hypothetical protein